MSSGTKTLGKQERMKSRKRIDALFNGGKKLQQFPFRLLYHISKETGSDKSPFPVQAGFTASSRNFPRAVDRNRLKRLMRESFRQQKTPLVEAAQKTGKRVELFLIYTGRDIAESAGLENSLDTLLRKLIREINESIS